jgi:hypothetical protein
LQKQNTFQVDVLNLFSRPVKKLTTNEIEEIHKNIFETLFHVCNTYKIEYLVFIPIGCGAFKHNPNYVAEKFKFYLNFYKLITLKKNNY